MVGILSSRNLFRQPREARWESHLKKPVYVPESLKVSDLLRRFQRTGVHMAVVIDEHGKLCGVITVVETGRYRIRRLWIEKSAATGTS